MSNFVFDEKRPLDKAKGESKVANAALQDYFDLGVKRSLRKLLDLYRKQEMNKESTKQPPTTKWTTMGRWSDQFEWVKRVNIADVMHRDEYERLLQERRLQVAEEDFKDGGVLRELGRNILTQSPNFMQTRTRHIPAANGQAAQTIITLKLNAGLGVKAIEAGSKIQRNTLGMATEHLEVDELSGTSEEQLTQQRFDKNRERLIRFTEKQEEKKRAETKKENAESNE